MTRIARPCRFLLLARAASVALIAGAMWAGAVGAAHAAPVTTTTPATAR